MDLKIEKLKTFFSADKPDETKFQKTENHYVRTSVFDTLSSDFRIIFIILFYFIGSFLLLAGIIMKLADRNLSLRRRVEKLENAVFKNDLLIIENAD